MPENSMKIAIVTAIAVFIVSNFRDNSIVKMIAG